MKQVVVWTRLRRPVLGCWDFYKCNILRLLLRVIALGSDLILTTADIVCGCSCMMMIGTTTTVVHCVSLTTVSARSKCIQSPWWSNSPEWTTFFWRKFQKDDAAAAAADADAEAAAAAAAVGDAVGELALVRPILFRTTLLIHHCCWMRVTRVVDWSDQSTAATICVDGYLWTTIA